MATAELNRHGPHNGRYSPLHCRLFCTVPSSVINSDLRGVSSGLAAASMPGRDPDEVQLFANTLKRISNPLFLAPAAQVLFTQLLDLYQK